MKQTFALLLLFTFSYTSHAQETDKTRIYEIRSNIPVVPCDVVGNVTNSVFSVPPYRSRFAVVRYKGDSVVVRFLKWSTNDVLRKSFNDTTMYLESSSKRPDSAVTVHRYFLVTRNDLDSNCIKVFSEGLQSSVFTLGLVTMPMKLRLGKNFDFQGNLSLGTTAGAKMRISKYNPNYLNLLFGASISTVSLDSFSTNGKVIGQPLTNIAVFSPSMGAVFEFGKAQAGVFYGWDILNKSTQSKYTWIYNRKPWISIGFGFAIFSINSQSNTQTQTQSSPPKAD